MKNTCKDNFCEKDMTLDVFKGLLGALPTAEVLILNGIGEPLLHPLLNEFIKTAKTRMPPGSTVGFQTNGLLIDDKVAHGLIDAGLDKICLSIDAVDPQGFRLIRKGGELSGVLSAMQALRLTRIRHNAALEIGIEFVLRRDNIAKLPETIRWAGSMGVDFALVTHLFPYHPDLVSQTLYDANLDESVAVFLEYQLIAESKGLDIRRYQDVYMKYEKNSEDTSIIELVDSMMADALTRGVTLNIQKLFDMEHSWVEKTEVIFQKARDAAYLTGLDLKLPGIIPKSVRRCEFVEEGCAFISVDGLIHPCYFLWHQYKCFINGLQKAVGPRSFGSLTDRTILEIWNDRAFCNFRRNVLTYDYPFCFNCNFALCDYVDGEDFSQDCYINTEPCAVCLWCMDIFQCLK
jgi:putative metalloenzyme radical SAM/SPASM domain maturase